MRAAAVVGLALVTICGHTDADAPEFVENIILNMVRQHCDSSFSLNPTNHAEESAEAAQLRFFPGCDALNAVSFPTPDYKPIYGHVYTFGARQKYNRKSS